MPDVGLKETAADLNLQQRSDRLRRIFQDSVTILPVRASISIWSDAILGRFHPAEIDS
jgi:hypothetical protein